MDEAGRERAFTRAGRVRQDRDAPVLLDRSPVHDHVLVRQSGDGVVESPFDQRQRLVGRQRLERILTIDEETRLRPHEAADAFPRYQRDVEIGERADGLAELRRIESGKRLADLAERGRQSGGEGTETEMDGFVPHCRHATRSSRSSFWNNASVRSTVAAGAPQRSSTASVAAAVKDGTSPGAAASRANNQPAKSAKWWVSPLRSL